MTHWLAVSALLIGVSGQIRAQSPSIPGLDSTLAQLTAPSPDAREKGFYGLVELGWAGRQKPAYAIAAGAMKGLDSKYPAYSDSLRLDLIGLLRVESDYIQNHAGLSEDYMSYFGDLIEAVSSFRDKRSESVLLNQIATGDMAVTALASFGDDVIAPALSIYNAPGSVRQLDVVRLFSKMVDPVNRRAIKSPNSIQSIEDTLVRASLHENVFVRVNAVGGLVLLHDPPAIAALQRLAEADPATLDVKGTTHFPVREAARQGINSIAATR